jgi:hypothetical protein
MLIFRRKIMSVFNNYEVKSGAFGTECTFIIKARNELEAAFLVGTMAEEGKPNGIVDLTSDEYIPEIQAMIRVSSVTKVAGTETTVEDDPDDDFAQFVLASLLSGGL